jgi:hypothetical protein
MCTAQLSELILVFTPSNACSMVLGVISFAILRKIEG